ncbi:hypothetical protein ATZ36_14475 [Candidatus Endomicrobiellum trichonymphae]|uniref:Uncharacterized protein n=1 Tax=Endomicrobium trichonymphae TaxID=1408204 RepID=A0A1E5ILV9_ENDTX|nr:hypothetical protein ATZ36_14475 [Candidatus Endomicrobium trichonymphae]
MRLQKHYLNIARDMMKAKRNTRRQQRNEKNNSGTGHVFTSGWLSEVVNHQTRSNEQPRPER